MAKSQLKSSTARDPNKLYVSQSRVKQWRKCHYAHYLKYVRNLKKKRKSRSLTFGTIVHEMLDAYGEGDDPFKVLKKIEKDNAKMFKIEREEYGEIIDDIRQIMTEYFDYYDEKDLTFIRINKRSGEHPFEIELMKDVIWNGKIDALARTPNKLQWCVERKSFKRRPSDDDLWRNIQSSTYLTALNMLGWTKSPVEGMVWDYIHNKSPTKPQILKKGGVISERNITTLPITVKETLAELGMKEKNHKGYLERVDAGLSDWFFRIHTPVDSTVVDHLFEDFKFSIVEMVKDQEAGHKTRDKCIEQHCNWCDFEGICRAELEGNDVDYVIQHDYEVRKETNIYETALTD